MLASAQRSVDALVARCAGTADGAVGSGFRGAALRSGKPELMENALLLVGVAFARHCGECAMNVVVELVFSRARILFSGDAYGVTIRDACRCTN